MRLLDRFPLGLQIGALVALLGLLLVGATAYGAGDLGVRALGELAGQRLKGVAANAARQLDRNTFERRREIAAFARLQAVAEAAGDPPAMRRLLEELQKGFPHYVWIGFADARGVVRAGTQGRLEGRFVAAEPWFRNAREGVWIGRLREQLELVRSGAISDAERVLDISAPVLDTSGRRIGVIAANLSWVWAEELRQQALQLDDMLAGVELTGLDADGRVLLGDRLPAGEIRRILDRRALALSSEGTLPADGHDEGYLYAWAEGEGYRDFDGLGWLLVARQPAAAAFVEVNRLERAISVMGAVGAVLGCLVAAFLVHRLTSPLRRLADEARLLDQDGNGMLSRLYGSAEVVELSQALRSLLRRLAGSKRRLHDQHREMTEAVAERDLYRALARTDPLTGLLNRRALFEAAAEELPEALEGGRSLGVVVFDIDHFKLVNDSRGHAAGDEVIRHIAGLAREEARAGDLVARFGGEEFVVVLPESGLHEAAALAERLRRSVERSAARHDGKAVRVTISAGCSTVLPGDADLQDAIDRADEALYEAKTAGRNRIARAAQRSGALAG